MIHSYTLLSPKNTIEISIKPLRKSEIIYMSYTFVFQFLKADTHIQGLSKKYLSLFFPEKTSDSRFTNLITVGGRDLHGHA
jgi:hypothetical protein